MYGRKGVPEFRRWLVNKLKQSRWVAQPETTIEETAARLWVHPDALRAAQAELNAERQRAGRALVRAGTYHRLHGSATVRIFEVAMPQSVLADWQAYCKHRGIEESVLLRSIVHHVLLQPTNPSWVGRGWYYRGQRVKLKGPRRINRKWPHFTNTRITYGALQALQQRALNSGVKAVAIVRGAIIELLEGRLTRLKLVTYLEEMYEDPARYNTLEPAQ